MYKMQLSLIFTNLYMHYMYLYCGNTVFI